MKTFNLLKYFVGLMSLTVIMNLVACGNSGGSGSQPVPPPVGIPQCVNCQTLPGSSFFQAESQDYYGVVKMNWNFNGQAVMNNPYPAGNYGYGYGYGSPIISYNGPVSAQGGLQVLQTMSLGYCQLPAGSYSFGTTSPGQWSAGIVSHLRLQATGPSASIVMTLTSGQVSAKTGSQLGQTWSEIAPVGRIFGNVMIESVNGYPCSTSLLVQ